MFDLSDWLAQFLSALDDGFGDRVWFVGLQGSRGRGEAVESSDIDMVVILDELRAPDILAYRGLLDGLPHRELCCGFLSGKAELLNWDAADLFQFYYDTTPIRGSLDELCPRLDVERAIRLGACNLYHGCVHNMVHGRSGEVLRGLYKSASFLAQAVCFRQTGRFVRHQQELREVLTRDDQQIVDIFLHLKNGGAVNFDEMSRTLFEWVGRLIWDDEN